MVTSSCPLLLLPTLLIVFVTESLLLVTAGGTTDTDRLAKQRCAIDLGIADGHHGLALWLLIYDIFRGTHRADDTFALFLWHICLGGLSILSWSALSRRHWHGIPSDLEIARMFNCLILFNGLRR